MPPRSRGNLSSIRNEWKALGWERSGLGYPTTGEFCGLRDGGCGQHFESGSIYWSKASGAHYVWGGIKAEWARLGWEAGSLGYPTTGEFPVPGGGISQRFQSGALTFWPATGRVQRT